MTEKSIADVLESHEKEDERRFAALTSLVTVFGKRLDKVERKVAVGAAAGVFVGNLGLELAHRFPEILTLLGGL